MNYHINCLEILCCYVRNEGDGRGGKFEINTVELLRWSISFKLFRGFSCALNQKVMVLNRNHKREKISSPKLLEFFHTWRCTKYKFQSSISSTKQRHFSNNNRKILFSFQMLYFNAIPTT